VNHSKVLYLAGLLFAFADFSSAQERYFYKSRDFGSEALYNPISLVVNGGYGIMQFDRRSHDIVHFPYRESWRNLARNLGDPYGVISRYGWGNFISREILPLSLRKAGAQWLPNYKLHLIGGGMSYRMTAEWYETHGFPRPRLFSLATMAAYHLLNEVVENENYIGDNVDPIADLYFFDIAGIILFSFDGVSRFFADRLNLADWSAMPSYRFRDTSIRNHGQNFSVKWRTPFHDRWHLFYCFGNLGLTGLSYKRADGTAISLAAGAVAKEQVIVDKFSHRLTVNLVWNCGLFYDRDNSLLASLQVCGLESRMVVINLYPGMLRRGRFSPGLWLSIDRQGRPLFGVATAFSPGITLN
jgi:hypothetical protein